MQIGYNTNGFAHHRIDDAIEILREIGYRSIAVTLENDFFDPPDRRGVADCLRRLKPLFRHTDTRITIETGARFILDRRRKHNPTLVSASAEARGKRFEFLAAAIEIAGELDADSVSFWSGCADAGTVRDEVVGRFVDGVSRLVELAESRGVRLALEPEPGMVVERMSDFDEVIRCVDAPLLGLTLDVGHVHCLEDGHIADHVRRWSRRLFNVHVEDMKRGTHEHLMFGDGGMDIPGVLASLRLAGYAGPCHVELPRHSHDAVNIARQAFEFLRRHCGASDHG